ncbi:hypothetical protein ACY2EQ_26405, partial [Escherichia coli]
RLRLNWKDRFGDCAPPSQLPRFKELISQRTFEKPPCKAVFSFTEQEITRCSKGSQEDHFSFAT